jgi:hypothetical protein
MRMVLLTALTLVFTPASAQETAPPTQETAPPIWDPNPVYPPGGPQKPGQLWWGCINQGSKLIGMTLDAITLALSAGVYGLVRAVGWVIGGFLTSWSGRP